MKEEVYSIVHKDGVIQASSKEALLGATELEALRDPETRFLHKESAEEYLKQLIERYGAESERVKLLKQRIKESFEGEK